ncbi:MAG TPA: alpha/beta fold hydrolase, partial [Candidatus Wirthbacteria bacterium]|nr:alpha/beta fold hydrolase [Candidatus Wirthbacteria bacterium]
SREVNSTDPDYYKWTQWIFIQLFKHGLAFKEEKPINWCPSCKIGLANEEVVDGKCERCGEPAKRKNLNQWIVKITDYAERLINGLEETDFIEKVKAAQVNWIGKKDWIDISYQIKGVEAKIIVSTTRPDTNFGATFVVLAPEHPVVEQLLDPTSSLYQQAIEGGADMQQVAKYVRKSLNKSELDRISEGRAKTGVFTGLYAINNLNDYPMPIWITDFVLMTVGTGAVVGVPGHDLRDFEFAQTYNLPVVRVVVGEDGDTSEITKPEQVQEKEGHMVNSEFLNGLDIHEATRRIMDYLEEKGWGKKTTRYHLRDWIFSRQHYWGEPIPMIYCEHCAQKTAPKVLILHGTTGDSQEGWFPWLKQELEARGLQVACPDLPDTNAPNYATRMKFLEDNYADYLDENTIVIGHSSGPITALHLAMKYKLKKLILVAPYLYVPPEDDDKLEIDLGQAAGQGVRELMSHAYDFKSITANVGEIIALFGDKDPWVPAAMAEYVSANLPQALIRSFAGRGHFSTSTQDPLELPELRGYFPAVDRSAGWIPVEIQELPITLPEVDKYEPTDTGESPLANITDWVETPCPVCGQPARRETDTMPNWAGSDWYFLRYLDPHNQQELAAQDKLSYWMPVDVYVGGDEHNTLHLLYSRFIYQFLHDIWALPRHIPEPYFKRLSHGVILGSDNQRMSKSQGNVIIPDDVCSVYGVDAVRAYMMFMGPFDSTMAWNENALKGVSRFLNRFNSLIKSKTAGADQEQVKHALHKLIKKVGSDLDEFHFNTGVAAMMEFLNEYESHSW